MSLIVTVPPYAEPVHLSEMKLHLKQDDITADDTILAASIVSARSHVETETGRNVPRCRTMLATTFQLTLHDFYEQFREGGDQAVSREADRIRWNHDAQGYHPCGYLQLPRVPAISVDSITYVDVSGATQTLDAATYVLDAERGRIDLAYNQYWPSVRYQPNAVTVQFKAGMAATFTAVAATGVVTIQGRSYSVGDRVRVMNSGGALPAGLSANTDYFVIAGGKLSATSGGAAVDITDAGTGTHFIGLDLTAFEQLRSAIKLLVAHWNANREGVITGLRAAAVVVPMAVESLIGMNQA